MFTYVTADILCDSVCECVCILESDRVTEKEESCVWLARERERERVQLLGIYCERLMSRLRLVLSDRPSGSVSGTANPVNPPLQPWTL